MRIVIGLIVWGLFMPALTYDHEAGWRSAALLAPAHHYNFGEILPPVGEKRRIVTFVETPEDISDRAVRMGLIAEDQKSRVRGLAQFNKALTYCRIYVPPLRPETLWTWQHEIHGHCDKGAFHK